MTFISRRAFGALAAAVLMLTGGLVAAAPGSFAAAPGTALLTGIRTGVNPGFDRIVLDMTGPAPGAQTFDVDELVADASGEIVWLTGEYFTQVTIIPAAGHDENGNATYTGSRKFRTRNLSNVMAVAITGDWEGALGIGIGMRNRTWVKTFTLTSPTRMVIDVGH
jgi:hypothetical protein